MKPALILFAALLLAQLNTQGAPEKTDKASAQKVTFLEPTQSPKDADSERENLILGFRGKSKYQIVIPDPMPNQAAANSVARAADLLRAAFSVNGIKLEIKKESDADMARPGFYLGATKLAAANGVDARSLAGWNYVHKAVGSHMIILGNDETDTLVGKRNSARESPLPYEGTLFGTAEFLYRFVGARFLSPDESGTTFLPRSIIHVPRDLHTQGSPHFEEHDIRNSTELFYTANHCRRFTRIWSNYGHQHPRAVPMSEYGKTHPEYFMLSGAVRQPQVNSEEGQLCLSNAEVRELIYKHVLARCDEGFDVVEIG